MSLIDCILCEKLFESARGQAKYCEECKRKQALAKIEQTKQRKKKHFQLQYMKSIPVSRTCPVCNKTFKTNIRVFGLERTFCSVACRIISDQKIQNGIAFQKPSRKKKSVAV